MGLQMERFAANIARPLKVRAGSSAARRGMRQEA